MCPAGTFNPIENMASEDQCTQCTAGAYCQLPGQSNYTGLCAPGYYCTIGESPLHCSILCVYSRSLLSSSIVLSNKYLLAVETGSGERGAVGTSVVCGGGHAASLKDFEQGSCHSIL